MDFGFTYHSCGATVIKYIILQSSSIATLLQCLSYPMYTLATLTAQLGLNPFPGEDGCVGTTITLRFSEKLLDVKELTSSTG